MYDSDQTLKLICILPVTVHIQQTVFTFAVKKRTYWPNGFSYVNVTKKQNNCKRNLSDIAVCGKNYIRNFLENSTGQEDKRYICLY